MRTVVIGSGISALAYAFYQSDCVVVAPDWDKEQPDNPFVFLHKTPYSDRLLKDLGVDVPIVEVAVAPIPPSKNAERKTGSTASDRSTLGAARDRIGFIGNDGIMLAWRTSIAVIRSRLQWKLVERGVVVHKEGLQRIFTDSVQLADGSLVGYDHLVSTLHFATFQSLHDSWEAGSEAGTTPLRFFIKKGASGSFIKYYEDGPISKTAGNVGCNLTGNEIVASCSDEDAKAVAAREGCKLIEVQGLRVTGRIAPAPRNCTFTGRFATGNCRWKLEDSLFIAQHGPLLSHLFSTQIRFDRHIEKVTGIVGEERAKNLLLHLFSEVAEVQREMNWKIHTGVRIKDSNALMELTDVFKLTLALVTQLGFTEREFIESFNTKSEMNWDKFLNEHFTHRH